jgi:hypothetical protein
VYFPPVSLSGKVFQDAGAFGFNNPTNVAAFEISRIPEWKGKSVGVIVSLGTELNPAMFVQTQDPFQFPPEASIPYA